MHTTHHRHITLSRLVALMVVALLLTSCSTLRYTGVNRLRSYTITHTDVPQAFDGYRIAFVSDFHLESKFKQRQLQGAVKALQATAPDLLLLGGDYQEGCHHVEPLFEALAKATPPDGTYAVMGNNDYERCTELIRQAMKKHHIHLLEDTITHVHRANDSIALWGVNPYRQQYPTVQSSSFKPQSSSLTNEGLNVTAQSQQPTYTLLLTHTPDYIEEPEAAQAHLALAGHTHGGQITLLGLYAPVTASKYGSRLLTGLRHSTHGVPIIISNGLGTSRYPIRLFAPTDIIIITLKRTAANTKHQSLPPRH